MGATNYTYNYTSPTGDLIAKKEYYRTEDGALRAHFVREPGLATSLKEGIPIFYNFEALGKSKQDEPAFLVSNEATADLLTNMGMTAVCSSFPLTAKHKDKIDNLVDDSVKEIIGDCDIYVLLNPTSDADEVKFRKKLMKKLSKSYSGSVFFVNLQKDYFWKGREDQKPQDKPIRVFRYLKEFPDALTRILMDIEHTRDRNDKTKETKAEKKAKREVEAKLLADEKTKELLEPVMNSDFDPAKYPATASYLEGYARFAYRRQKSLKSAEEKDADPKSGDLDAIYAFDNFRTKIADGSEQDRADIEMLINRCIVPGKFPPKIDKQELVIALFDKYHPFCIGKTIYYYDETLSRYVSGSTNDFTSFYFQLSGLLGNPTYYEYGNSCGFGKMFLKLTQTHPELVKTRERLNISRNFLTFQNGVLDVEQKKLVAPSWEQYQKDVLATNFIPEYLYDDAAFKEAFEKSRFAQFLEECFREPETADALQMVFGLFLIPNLRKVHKLFFLSGAGGNGKGVIFDILEDMFENHEEIIGSVGFEGMCRSDFLLATLSGKRANLAKDTRITGDILMSDTVKSISGGDVGITLNPKFCPPHKEDLDLTLISGINTPITFTEKTNAMKRRVMYFPFKSQFGTEEDIRRDLARGVGNVRKLMDPNLASKLKNNELDLIVMWALRGYYRLKEEYNWKIPESGEMVAEREFYDEESNTFEEFLSLYGKIDASVTPDMTTKKGGGSKMYVPLGVLLRAYQDFVFLDHGDRHALGDAAIKQYLMREVGLKIEKAKREYYTGKTSTTQYVFGLSINSWITEMYNRGYDDEEMCRRLHNKGAYSDLYAKPTLYSDPDDQDSSGDNNADYILFGDDPVDASDIDII